MAKGALKNFGLLAWVLAAFALAAGQEQFTAKGPQSQSRAGGTVDTYGGEFMGEAPPPEEPLSLWYRRPAKQWVEALPVGNGRLGAMVFGGTAT